MFWHHNELLSTSLSGKIKFHLKNLDVTLDGKEFHVSRKTSVSINNMEWKQHGLTLAKTCQKWLKDLYITSRWTNEAFDLRKLDENLRRCNKYRGLA
jgi:hypothetical protein